MPRRRWLMGCAAIMLLAVAALPAAEKPTLFEEALAVSKHLDPDTDIEACRRTWAKLLAEVRADLKQNGARVEGGAWQATPTIAALNRILLTHREVTYISNKYWRDSLFTSALMKNRGNCMATSLLYYLVALELNLPIRMAFLPDHAYARWDDGTTVVNIETTGGGKAIADDVYAARMDLDEEDRARNGYLVKLSGERIHAVLLLTWSHTFSTLNQDKEARTMLTRARKLDPHLFQARLLDIHYLLDEGKAEEAGAAFRALANDKTCGRYGHALAVLGYSKWLESRGQADAALELLNAHYHQAPGPQKVTMIERMGQLYRHKRDFDRAIAMHYLHTKLDPSESSYNDLGSALTEAHRDKEAIEAYEKALTYNPENFFTTVILAGLYERAGDRAKGRAYFATIAEPREHKITWYCALVWYYANINEEAKMLADMKRALDMDASGHVYHYFVREPDLDKYREHAAFKALMDAHKKNATAGAHPEAQAPAAEPAKTPEKTPATHAP